MICTLYPAKQERLNQDEKDRTSSMHMGHVPVNKFWLKIIKKMSPFSDEDRQENILLWMIQEQVINCT